MRSLRPLSPVVTGLSLLATACASPTGTLPGVAVVTDATSYVAEPVPGTPPRTLYAFRVIVRTTNESLRPFHLGRCNPESAGPIFGVVLHAEPAGARSAYDPAWACVGGEPIVIPPGSVRVDTLTIQGPTVVNGVTGEPLGVAEGTMSLLFASEGGGIMSNRFSVSRAP